LTVRPRFGHRDAYPDEAFDTNDPTDPETLAMTTAAHACQLIECPNCSTTVMINENGRCPACQHQIVGERQIAVQPQVESADSDFDIDALLSSGMLGQWVTVLLRQKEVVLYRSIFRPLFGFVIAAGLVGGAVWFCSLPNMSEEALLLIAAPLTLAAMLFFGFSVWRLCDTSPKLRLSFEGITDYQSRSRQLVRWDDIVSARYYECSRNGSRECAVVTLTVRGGREVPINVDALNWSPEAIYSAIARRADLS
jgi:hypothetical protein